MSIATLRREEIERQNAALPDLQRGDSEVCLATWVRQATPGTAYWRCELPARQLPGQMIKLTEQDFSLDEETMTLSAPRLRGALVWQHLGDDARSRLAFKLHDQGIRTLQELDDNYLQPSPYGGTWKRTHREAIESGMGYSHELHRHLTPKFDGVIVSTEHLANLYEPWNENVYLCPNSVDPADWESIERHTDDVLRIGYYGSASHVRDWPLVKKAMKWASRQPGVEIVFVGFTPPGWSDFEQYGWTLDLAAARSYLGRFDVGICPIAPGHFADAKSDVKALEYAMAGVMPIVSRTEPYAPWWRDEGWDFTAQSPAEWEEIIRHIVKNPEIVKDEAARAKRYVLAQRTIQDNIWRWKEAVGA
jgi:hypothetical protein